MKKMFFAVTMLLLSSVAVLAQELSKEQVNELIDGGRYKIVATRAITNLAQKPSVDLTPDYGLSVTTDSLTSNLPFYGRAYSASFSNESPLSYTSTDFKIEKKVKKGRRSETIIVTIKAKAPRRNGTVDTTIEVSENGSAVMNVRSNDLSSITFYGNLERLP